MKKQKTPQNFIVSGFLDYSMDNLKKQQNFSNIDSCTVDLKRGALGAASLP